MCVPHRHSHRHSKAGHEEQVDLRGPGIRMLKTRPHSSSLRDHRVPRFLLWWASQRSSQPLPLRLCIPYSVCTVCVYSSMAVCHAFIVTLAPTAAAAAAAKSLQSCPTLCDPIDGSPPGSSVPGILQEGTLEWVAIAFSLAPTTAWQLSVSHAQVQKADWLSWVFTAESPGHKSCTHQKNGCLWARYQS